jgi:hypothetical protein
MIWCKDPWQAKLEADRATTFRQCAQDYIAAHRSAWKNLDLKVRCVRNVRTGRAAEAIADA